jgi:dCTP deaminase
LLLTGTEIERERQRGVITIDPFDPECVEPNSYGFHLGASLITYPEDVLDPSRVPTTETLTMGPEGNLFEPGRLYLGVTAERMGSTEHAATLYANRSAATLGVWIQHSAPLGHCGAVIPWTLEIRVAQRVRLYPSMLIGKIAFWRMQGEPVSYAGRYGASDTVVASRFWADKERPLPRKETPVP